MTDFFEQDPDFDGTDRPDPDCSQRDLDSTRPSETDDPQEPAEIPHPTLYPEPELEDELSIEKGWHRNSLKDPEVFGLFYDKYYDRIFKLLFNMMRHRQDAETLTQAAFTTAFERRGEFEFRGTTMGAWIYRIARNAAIKELKSRKKWPRVPLEHEGAADNVLIPLRERPDHLLQDRQQRENLARAMDGLDPDCYSWLQMRYVTGLTTPQLAVIAGVKTGTMKSRLNRCREKLRDLLDALPGKEKDRP